MNRDSQIIESILKNAQKQELFSYGAYSPDGDSRYSDHMKGYVTNGGIEIFHISSGAAGGMDSYTGGMSDEKAVAKLSSPISAYKIVDWIKSSLRNSRYPFLKYVKLKEIVWFRANGSQEKGLTNNLVEDVLKTHGFEVEKAPKAMPLNKWQEANADNLKDAYEAYKKRMKVLKIRGLDFKTFSERIYTQNQKGTRVDWDAQKR